MGCFRGKHVVRLKPSPVCSGTSQSISQPRKPTCPDSICPQEAKDMRKCCRLVDIFCNNNMITLRGTSIHKTRVSLNDSYPQQVSGARDLRNKFQTPRCSGSQLQRKIALTPFKEGKKKKKTDPPTPPPPNTMLCCCC